MYHAPYVFILLFTKLFSHLHGLIEGYLLWINSCTNSYWICIKCYITMGGCKRDVATQRRVSGNITMLRGTKNMSYWLVPISTHLPWVTLNRFSKIDSNWPTKIESNWTKKIESNWPIKYRDKLTRKRSSKFFNKHFHLFKIKSHVKHIFENIAKCSK